MTFESAYCQELGANVSAYKARREFFAQDDDNLRFTFCCPDEKCGVELTAVNIYTVAKTKHRPHFRTWPNGKHSQECDIVRKDTNFIDANSSIGHGHGIKYSAYPSKLLLIRPPKEATSSASKYSEFDDEFDVEIRQKTYGPSNNKRCVMHTTSYLENVVDSYERMTGAELTRHCIELNGQNRTYARTFKKIVYFEDGKNFIFYGDIEPIKEYGKNYAITFKDKAWFNKRAYRVSVYITEELISKYRLRRLFRTSMETLAKLGGEFKSATCYFVGAYPKLKTVNHRNGSFDVLSVDVTNLDHFVVKFTE